jgi:DNA-binding NarL/FixJ family response regulator
MTSIKVILAEDHHVVRAAVAAYLNREQDIEVVGEVSDGEALPAAVAALRPDLLLLDAHMPGHQVIASTRALRRAFPDLRILILSAYDREEYIVGALREGVAGYVLKDDAPEMLIAAIRAVARGGDYLSPRVSNVLLHSLRYADTQSQEELTEREREVLRLMAQGKRNDQIAAELALTTQTVKNYVRAIFRKLGVESRVEAVLFALNAGLAKLEPWNTDQSK